MITYPVSKCNLIYSQRPKRSFPNRVITLVFPGSSGDYIPFSIVISCVTARNPYKNAFFRSAFDGAYAPGYIHTNPGGRYMPRTNYPFPFQVKTLFFWPLYGSRAKHQAGAFTTATAIYTSAN
jgi:hypothetical protein